MNSYFFIALLAATVQSGTPVLYATLGEILTERAGVLNLGIEGIMMVGALGAFLASQAFGSPLIGFVAGGLCGAGLAGLHGLVCLVFQGNQVVSGLALTILGTGLANFWGTPYVGQTAPGFSTLPVPLLGRIPVLGPIFFQHDPLVYLSLAIPPLMWLFFKYTRWGIGIRAAGEHPGATAAVGLPVFDFVTMINYVWATVMRRRFDGFM